VDLGQRRKSSVEGWRAALRVRDVGFRDPARGLLEKLIFVRMCARQHSRGYRARPALRLWSADWPSSVAGAGTSSGLADSTSEVADGAATKPRPSQASHIRG
jgi:hypothetical protein